MRIARHFQKNNKNMEAVVLNLRLKDFDKVNLLVDGIDHSDTPMMDMVRVVGLIEGISPEEVQEKMPTYVEVMTAFNADVSALYGWLSGGHTGNDYDTDFEIDGVVYSMSFAELVSPSRVDLVRRLEMQLSKGHQPADVDNSEGSDDGEQQASPYSLAEYIAQILACYCYCPSEIDVQLEANKMDNEIYVNQIMERFMSDWNKRWRLFYEHMGFLKAMRLRSFFLRIGER